MCAVKKNSKQLIAEDFGLTLRGLKWFLGPTQIFWSSKTGYTFQWKQLFVGEHINDLKQ